MFTQKPSQGIDTIDLYVRVMNHYHNRPEKKSALYQRMKHRLIGMIKTAADFRNVMYTLNLAERAEFYLLMKEKLPPINKVSDFLDIMTFLPIEERLKFYGREKEKLFEKTKTGMEFGEIDFFLPELHDLLFNDLIHFKKILKPSEFSDATRHCSAEEIIKVSHYFKPATEKVVTNEPLPKKQEMESKTATTYLNHHQQSSRRRILCDLFRRCFSASSDNSAHYTKKTRSPRVI